MENKRVFKYIKICIMFFLILILLSINVQANDNKEDTNNWDEWQKEDYWEWHTRETTKDMAYNGKHIQIQDNAIDFYGYGVTSYKDFLYKEYKNPGKKIFEFRIDEQKANYHTLDGAGFIFNAKKENNKLSGYVVLFTDSNVDLYKLKDIDISKFETTASKSISDYGTLIKSVPKIKSLIHDLKVEATPTNIKVTEGGNELLNSDLDYSSHEGESFGLIASYVQHSCSILSKIEFSQIKMTIEDYEAKITNTDTEDNAIAGSSFEIKDESGNVINTGTADENGILYVKGLNAGKYTIQQKSVPEGYVLNNEVYTFEINENGKVVNPETGEEINIVIKNEKKKKENNITENKIEENTVKPSNIIKKDNTVSDKVIPDAGNKIIKTVMIIAIFMGISVFLIIKLKEYNDVK